ncbi:hypothetical protein [Mesobacillus zeae]|uniref:hypothetical protein n=1 Tax=Mesobacillus zeae TaxID=1917180 RepID=UPI0030090379
MTFKRVEELETEIDALEKKLKAAEVDRMMMEKYLHEKGLTHDYIKTAENEISEAQAGILRRKFKVVSQNE